jgi:carbon-monoxide dehydrogenase large subunit
MSLSPTGTGIGQPVRRREDLRLLTGRGRYSDDVNVPGQAYAVMVRSPHAHARIRSIDVVLAMTAPGVLAVLTGHDLLADGLKPIPHAVRTGNPADIQLENTDGSPPFIPPHYPMAIDEVRHVGDIVAMVVADRLAAAKDAAELVMVDYEELPAVVHSRQAVAAGAPLAWSDAASDLCLDATVVSVPPRDAALRRAAHGASERLGAAHRRRDDGATRRRSAKSTPRPDTTRCTRGPAARCVRVTTWPWSSALWTMTCAW